MAFERRAVLTGMGIMLATGCARARRGAGGTVMGAVNWTGFKSSFLDPSGRIVDNGNGGVSHSEGQSYGLLLAVNNDDRATFDLILDWTERNLADPDEALFAWRYDPRSVNPVADTNNATDGDIIIAWALAEAGSKWGARAYAERSAAIRAAIRARVVTTRYGRQLLLPGMNGFVGDQAITLNPSYYVWPALDLFRELDGDQTWGRVLTDGEALLARARFGPHSLPTDWIDVTGANDVAPAAGKPARFGFDAIRVPLYARMGKRTGLLAPIRQYWQTCLANHQPIPAWIDVVSGEVAPYVLPAGGAAVAASLLGTTPPGHLSNDYYAASLQMLAEQFPL